MEMRQSRQRPRGAPLAAAVATAALGDPLGQGTGANLLFYIHNPDPTPPLVILLLFHFFALALCFHWVHRAVRLFLFLVGLD